MPATRHSLPLPCLTGKPVPSRDSSSKGYSPTFWLDTACIDQSNIGNGLKVLPINICLALKCWYQLVDFTLVVTFHFPSFEHVQLVLNYFECCFEPQNQYVRLLKQPFNLMCQCQGNDWNPSKEDNQDAEK